MSSRLPPFIKPMLAKLGEAFDSDEHLFEVKWDGIRGLLLDDGHSRSLLSRTRRDMVGRYPEFEGWTLPAGTALDGEIVVMAGDRPVFQEAMAREQARGRRIHSLAREKPAQFVVFDLLYQDFESCMEAPLSERRERLEALVESVDSSSLLLSQGIVGAGTRLFAEACERELEGVVAKRLSSSYQPGRRSGAWVKIKRSSTLYCVVLGYLVDDTGELKSLALGTDREGQLSYVGNVGSGLSDELRREFQSELERDHRDAPVVPASASDVQWVEPRLFCTVKFLEFTPGGSLRAPVFVERIEG